MQEVFVESFDATNYSSTGNWSRMPELRSSLFTVFASTRDVMITLRRNFIRQGSARIASTTEDTADPRAREPITAILTKSSTTPMYS